MVQSQRLKSQLRYGRKSYQGMMNGHCRPFLYNWASVPLSSMNFFVCRYPIGPEIHLKSPITSVCCIAQLPCCLYNFSQSRFAISHPIDGKLGETQETHKKWRQCRQNVDGTGKECWQQNWQGIVSCGAL